MEAGAMALAWGKANIASTSNLRKHKVEIKIGIDIRIGIRKIREMALGRVSRIDIKREYRIKHLPPRLLPALPLVSNIAMPLC